MLKYEARTFSSACRRAIRFTNQKGRIGPTGMMAQWWLNPQLCILPSSRSLQDRGTCKMWPRMGVCTGVVAIVVEAGNVFTQF